MVDAKLVVLAVVGPKPNQPELRHKFTTLRSPYKIID